MSRWMWRMPEDRDSLGRDRWLAEELRLTQFGWFFSQLLTLVLIWVVQ